MSSNKVVVNIVKQPKLDKISTLLNNDNVQKDNYRILSKNFKNNTKSVYLEDFITLSDYSLILNAKNVDDNNDEDIYNKEEVEECWRHDLVNGYGEDYFVNNVKSIKNYFITLVKKWMENEKTKEDILLWNLNIKSKIFPEEAFC